MICQEVLFLCPAVSDGLAAFEQYAAELADLCESLNLFRQSESLISLPCIPHLPGRYFAE